MCNQSMWPCFLSYKLFNLFYVPTKISITAATATNPVNGHIEFTGLGQPAVERFFLFKRQKYHTHACVSSAKKNPNTQLPTTL